MSLKTSLQYITKISAEKYALLQSELGLQTIDDFLNFFPNRYVDKSKIYRIDEIYNATAEVQLLGKITSIQEVGKGRGKRLTAEFEDETGSLELVWFRVPTWLKNNIKLDIPVKIYGKISRYGRTLSMAHPEMNYNPHLENQSLGLYPIYPSTEKLPKRGMGQKFFQEVQKEILLKNASKIEENLSASILNRYQLMGRKEAYQSIHFPRNLVELERAKFRLKFEEIFFFQLSYAIKNMRHKQKVQGNPFEIVGENFLQFYNEILPFELTDAQKKVIKEIRSDLKLPIQMNRLLQGDVGSGKTIVALLSMLLAKDNGFQSALMAPTEVLAQQHYQSFKELLNNSNIRIGLLTGSTKTKERKHILAELQMGTLDIIVGTHALIEEKVRFQNLGLAIIDEQHKFGVKQRSQLWKKNSIPPHVLVMTATPIPRTLALTYYSDLEVSIIDELPKGRKPIKTLHQTDAQRLGVFSFMKEEIKKGRQVYVVYPLIEESSQLEYKNLMDGYESLERYFPKPEYQLSIVHGRMGAEEKEYEMNRFKKGETQIMVSTTVIEVGVNVPNASVMVIESAEKFGLSQLHQLRGRVGRGAEKSFCILMTDQNISDTAKKRVSTMVKTQNGFEISEIDLEMRGPGMILGTQQSGNLGFKISSLTEDKEWFAPIRDFVRHLLSEDSNLENTDNQPIKKYFLENYKDKVLWSRIS